MTFENMYEAEYTRYSAHLYDRFNASRHDTCKFSVEKLTEFTQRAR